MTMNATIQKVLKTIMIELKLPIRQTITITTMTITMTMKDDIESMK